MGLRKRSRCNIRCNIVTLTEVATLNVKMPAIARFPGGFNVRPYTSDLVARLTFRPRGTGSKFKLRYVGSC